MDQGYISDVASEIEACGYRRVAIQSSDVSAASQLCTALQTRFRSAPVKREFYVLGDVFIGSCCTDVIAARRCAADFVLHVGDSCQSSLEPAMPIRLLFDQAQVDWDKLSPYLRNVLAGCTYSRLVLAYDSALHHLADRLEECLHSTGKTSFIAECRQRVESASDHSSADAASSDNLFCGRRVFARSNTGSRIYVSYNELSIGESDTLVLFVTTGSGRDATTDYIALSCVGSQFHVVTVDNGGISHRNCDDLGHTLRMRRYQKVEKLREASTVGILVIARTLRGSSALRHSLARLVEHHGKRSYTFSVNCLTEAKLANFPNVDLFCLLSCGESVLSLPDELARRVVVPFELLVAFDCVDWSLPYEFDFPRLLPHATASEGTEAAAAGGELRRLQGNLELKVQVESFMSSLQDNSKRTFGGVDPSHGLSEQPAIVPGFHGTASGYEHERRL